MRIYNGDCLKIMPLLSAKSVDMILCDLPYGVTGCHWDSVIPFEPLWENYKRLIKDRGAIVLTATQPFATDLINSNRKWFKYEMIWAKTRPAGFANANKQPLREHEDILVFYDKQPTYNPQKQPGDPYTRHYKKEGYRNGSCYHIKQTTRTVDCSSRMPTTIITIPNGRGELNNVISGRIHATQKPVELMEYLIKTYTNVGDIVLDNCAGSFTTGVACQNLGRHFIGIELDKNYYEKGKERMAMNRKLFDLTDF